MPAEMTGSVLSERQQWEDLMWIELGRTEYHRHRPTAEVRCYGSVLIVTLEKCKIENKISYHHIIMYISEAPVQKQRRRGR